MLLPTLALLAVPLPHDPGDWPQWRNESGDGLSHDVGWAPEGETRWTAEIGLGYSAVSVSSGRVFAFGFDAERALDVLRVLDLESGRELWKREWPGELRANQHEGGTLSTPAVAEGRVHVSTSSGEVVCLRAEDGEPVWRVNLATEHELDPGYYGFASSPLVADGSLYVGFDRAFALEAATGALLWRSEPLLALYSTPARTTHAGVPAVAIFSQNGLSVLARADGAVRASFPFKKDERRVNGATPVVVGERLFVSSAYEHGCALVEFPPEGARAVWEHKLMRNKMAGCVLVDGALYGFDESVLKCLDLEGAERWRVRGLGNGALSGGDGKLAILSSGGELVVARADAGEFQELARTVLFDEGVCWTPPTIAGGRILARNNRGTLVCRDHRAERRADAPLAAATTAATTTAELPTAAKLLARHLEAIGGAAALARHPSIHLAGTYEQRSVGFVPAPYEVRWAAPDRRRVEIQFPPPLDQRFAKDGVPGRYARVCDGAAAFELNPYRGDKLLGPAEEQEERAGARLGFAGETDALYTSLETVARVPFDERDCWRVLATTRDGRRRTLHFDAATGLLAGREAEDEALVVYRDYRAFDGLLLPTFERVFRPDGGLEETFRVERVTFEPAPEGCFARSAKIEELFAERAAGR
jgi:outer membrane protein assembly factor BamB